MCVCVCVCVYVCVCVCVTQVRHPGVADTILRDFSTMLTIAHLLSAVPAVAHLRLEDTLKQFAAPLKEQVCVCMCAARESRMVARPFAAYANQAMYSLNAHTHSGQ